MFPPRRTSAAFGVLATVGAAGIVLGVAPAAHATTSICGVDGTLISPTVCGQSFVSGTTTFTPTTHVSSLEALLVAGGGSGADQTSIFGYAQAGGGGGGQVTLLNFGPTTPEEIAVTVGGPGEVSSVADGTTTTTANPGTSAAENATSGGSSGNGNPGAFGGTGGGGGAGAMPMGSFDGGAGVVVSSLAPAGSLFSSDTYCYGGGGAVGVSGTSGIATCGGGQPVDSSSLALTAPVANSGGGGGGLDVTAPLLQRQGASGLVVLRWVPLVTVSFVDNGHGSAAAPQTFVVGSPATQPADPSETGWLFGGWYTDEALTVRADFTAPVMDSLTFYASWTPVLAATGGPANGAELPIGLAAVGLGAGLIGVTLRRRVNAK